MGKKSTKICKHCKSEIPQGAKVCPQCRKKQGMGCLIWIIIVVVALIAIGALVGGGGNKPQKVGETNTKADDSATSPSESTEGAKETIFKLGEIAELNGVQVSLTNYEESAGSEFNTPSDGNVFILAEFEIVNDTSEELTISSIMSFEAYADDYALNYSMTALMEKDTQLDGTIAAGKRMKGWIGWEVPQNYQNVEIHFTDNVWSNNKFVFLIEK